MGQTIKTFAIAFGSVIAMAVAIELVRHYEDRITDATDELLVAGSAMWARAMEEQQREAEFRRALPWLLWDVWQAEHGAPIEETT